MSCPRHPTSALLVLAFTLSAAALPVWAANGASGGRPATAATPAASGEQFLDGIAAVVNRQVITLGQLADKAQQVRRQMQQQNIPVPEEPVLKRQVLQQMINDQLQEQEARRVGIQVSDGQVEQAIQSVAQRNRLTPEQLKHEILATGMSWNEYRDEIRHQIQDDLLRQRFVEGSIHISESDVDAFLGMHEGEPIQAMGQAQPEPEAAPEAEAEAPPPEPVPSGPELIELAQILIEVPDYALSSAVDEKRKEAQAILARLKGGEDFAGVAASVSDGPQALQGGDMGIRPLKDWPDLFVDAISNVPAGGLSDVLQSGRGFHILKVLRRGYAQPPAGQQRARQQPAQQQRAPQPPPRPAAQPAQSGPMMVTQTHARHILIKTDQVTTDAQAKHTLETLRTRIGQGESFAELARRYSEDASAPQGGDLGWLNPGETVPAFEQAMNALQDGQISEPVETPFGWHLIQVQERRTQDMEDEFRRIQARRMLMQQRIGPAYEDWLDQLRSQAYIDNRLDKADSAQSPLQ